MMQPKLCLFAPFHPFAARGVVAALAVAWLAPAPFAAGATPVSLADGGQPRAAIVLPAEPEPLERKAADELIEHLRLISGAELPTVDAAGDSVLTFGGENWVTVKIANQTLAELGTGGILAPVMFWSPRDPDWQP